MPAGPELAEELSELPPETTSGCRNHAELRAAARICLPTQRLSSLSIKGNTVIDIEHNLNVIDQDRRVSLRALADVLAPVASDTSK